MGQVEPVKGGRRLSRRRWLHATTGVMMTAVGDAVYLFGGLDLTSGPDERGPLVGFNDLWAGRMGQE